MIQPYVRFCMQDTVDRKWNVSRSIWDYELIYIAEGSMVVQCDGTQSIANVGDIVFLRPDVPHILSSGSEVTRQPHVHFDFFKDDLSAVIPVSLKNKCDMTDTEKTYFRRDDLVNFGMDFPTILHLYDPVPIRNILYRIIDEYRLNLPMRETFMSALMTEMLVSVQRSYAAAKTELRHEHIIAFDNVQRYILDNIDRNVTVAELAEFAYLSKYHFIRAFTEYFGTTPHKFITRLRTDRAKELIIYDSSLSLGDIAEKMNFDSVQTFSIWFKKNVGIAPSEYREKRK